MPRKTYRARKGRRYGAAVPKKTQKIRKLAGQAPVTWAETISRSAGPIGKLAKSVATIAGLVNSEAKFVDTNVNGTGISNSGSYSQYLNAIAEGDDYTQRNGRYILMKNLQLKMRIRADATQTSGTSFGWAIIMDKKAEIALTATPWTDVFATTDPQSAINKSNSERFIILKRGFIGLSPGSSLIRYNNVFLNMKGIHVKYNGTTSTSYDGNAIFVVAISDQATLVPSLFFQARLNFHDN